MTLKSIQWESELNNFGTKFFKFLLLPKKISLSFLHKVKSFKKEIQEIFMILSESYFEK